MKIVIVILALLSLSGCGYFVDEDRARSAAEDMGFTDVRVTDRYVVLSSWEGCSKEDAVGFRVQAHSPAKKAVELTVCCGAILKGCTVRSH